jgi:alkaline phosphatase
VGPTRHPHPTTAIPPAAGRPDLTAVDTQAPHYLQEAISPLSNETHGGEDVGIWARGPGSAAVRGSLEQNAIFHILLQATPRLREKVCRAGGCDRNGVPVSMPGNAAKR